MRTVLFLATLLAFAPLGGCLEQISSGASLEEVIDPTEAACETVKPGRDSDGTLRVLTYDIAAFSEEMLDEFTNQSGYEIMDRSS